jgi:hypothetical protein
VQAQQKVPNPVAEVSTSQSEIPAFKKIQKNNAAVARPISVEVSTYVRCLFRRDEIVAVSMPVKRIGTPAIMRPFRAI